METMFIISNLLLWILVVFLSLAVYALVRQVGVLYERVAPAGALMVSSGPQVGNAAPNISVPNLNSSEPFQVGGESSDQRATLLLFISAQCPVCDSLLPAIKSMAVTEHHWLSIALASDGGELEHQEFIATKQLASFPYLLSRELGLTFQIGKLPYAILIDAKGIVRAHGLSNNREHLESLIEAMHQDVASIQEYVQRQQARQPAEVRYYEPS